MAQAKVIHAIVVMFKDILSWFDKLALAELKKSEKDATSSKAKNASSSKTKAKSKPSKSTSLQKSPVVNLLTALLSSIIDMLNSKLDANRAVFEGIAYCVLDHLGRRLFSTVFGHDRAPTIEDEILQSNVVDEIVDDESTPPRQKNEMLKKAMEIEAPYLIHLFRRVMAVAPAHLGPIINSKSGMPKQATKKGSTKGVLAITAKDCLQSTLVNAIFGTEGMDENDPFMDCLKMPLPGNATIPMPRLKEQEVDEWFKGEIWNMLGWEVLSRIGE